MSSDNPKELKWSSKWQDLPSGGTIPDGATSLAYETGSWRNARPLWNGDVCSHCLICWVYCPDSAVVVEDGKMLGIDFDYCKGCGICAHECPKAGALTMVADREEVA